MGQGSKLRYRLELDQIQGDIVPGFKKDHQAYLFFEIIDAKAARVWLKQLLPRLATAEEVATYNRLFKLVKKRAQEGSRPHWIKSTWVNVAFSAGGLQALQASLSLKNRDAFSAGLARRALQPLVDAQRLRALALPRLQQHQLAGSALVARIVLEEPLQGQLGTTGVAASLTASGQVELELDPEVQKGLAALGSPVVVPIVGHVGAEVEPIRCLQTVVRVRNPSCLDDEALENVGVHPDIGIWPN
jgi:hypothetical protein